LDYNQISDISSLKGLIHLTALYLDSNRIQNILPLEALMNIGEKDSGWEREYTRVHLGLSNNQISDISPLVSSLSIGDGVDLRGNPLNDEAYNVYIPAFQGKGVSVLFSPRQ